MTPRGGNVYGLEQVEIVQSGESLRILYYTMVGYVTQQSRPDQGLNNNCNTSKSRRLVRNRCEAIQGKTIGGRQRRSYGAHRGPTHSPK